ncbi:hypothetical protein IJ384_03480 [bacterium]|nr:hypothetical protein [bacterium]
MLMEDFLAETYYLIPALKSNYEHIHSEMCQYFGLFTKNNLLDEYKAIQGYIYINLTIIENLERTLSAYNDLVQESYTNK